MKRFRCLYLVLFWTAAAFGAFAAQPYDVLKTKAERYFHQKEWAQASAVYTLMLDQRPTVAATYGRAITANGMRNDTVAQMALMAKALENHVAFDSVFSRVRQSSFSLGKSHLYERFLNRVACGYPWLRRAVDGYLLRYYAFRRNGAEMTAFAEKMLPAAPHNVTFLSMLAEGRMLSGDFTGGLEAYGEVLRNDPSNYNALLCLGNWYALQATSSDAPAATLGDRRATGCPYTVTSAQARNLAIDYLSRADSLRPTPHVAVILKNLRNFASN